MSRHAEAAHLTDPADVLADHAVVHSVPPLRHLPRAYAERQPVPGLRVACLIDMTTPGIAVRPILLISGASPFCETTFEGVRVPAGNVVGRPGGGWEVAKAVLEHERAAISAVRDNRSTAGDAVEDVARAYGAFEDPVMRDRVAQLGIDLLASGLTIRRAARAGAVTSMLKLYGTELSKRRYELLVSVMGYRGLGWSGDAFDAQELNRTRAWLRSRASSIEGGTSEIQLNIIAKRVLGLPD